MKKAQKHLVYHHNMFGPSCEIIGIYNENDFKIYCRKEHRICIPNCTDCLFFGGCEMGKGVCCVWEETYESISETDHAVQHDEVYFEYQRAEAPVFCKK